ncbi:MAG: outer membrane beta-barrel protein [Chitinophagaceae bacterium]|nr:outer membrane beta-barrel protein [Chitinophagaceae bacterium]
MKYIDDDMDELFNKAGRQYPLNTEPKNWDAVHSALHPEETVVASKKNGLRRYLPLLLLLLIPAVYFVVQNDSEVNISGDRNLSTSDKSVSENKSDNNISDNSKKLTDSEISAQKISGNKNNTDNPVISAQDIPGDKKANKNNTLNSNSGSVLLKNKNVPGNLKNSTSSETLNQKTLNQNISGDKIKKTNPESAVHNNSNTTANQKNSAPHLLKNKSVSELHPHPLTTTPQPSKDIVINKPLRQLGGETSVPYIDKKKPSGKTGFYYGISAAPDVSTIKGQNIKGTGYSAGIIAGYQLNLRWSVEGGVLWSKKSYFTDGKYFNKKGAGIPDNINVHWLDGGCNMLEFPVLVRYDFSPKKNTFFGTVGLTSYMMKKEDYKYMADAGVGGGDYEGYRKYDHSGDHLFANLQLSAGYKFSLSPKMNMRIEPYLKAPLKKIGIGKMPITSAGLTFSLMRDFR